MNSQSTASAASSVANAETLLTAVNTIRAGLLDEKSTDETKLQRDAVIVKLGMTQLAVRNHLNAALEESLPSKVLQISQDIILFTKKLDSANYYLRASAWIKLNCLHEALLDAAAFMALNKENPEAYYLEAKIWFLLSEKFP